MTDDFDCDVSIITRIKPADPGLEVDVARFTLEGDPTLPEAVTQGKGCRRVQRYLQLAGTKCDRRGLGFPGGWGRLSLRQGCLGGACSGAGRGESNEIAAVESGLIFLQVLVLQQRSAEHGELRDRGFLIREADSKCLVSRIGSQNMKCAVGRRTHFIFEGSS